MTLYTFMDDLTGETVDLFYNTAEVPKIGDIIQHEGRSLRRVFCGHLGAAQVANATWGWPRVPVQGPQKIPGWKHHTRNGKILIPSKRHEQEYLAMTGRERD